MPIIETAPRRRRGPWRRAVTAVSAAALVGTGALVPTLGAAAAPVATAVPAEQCPADGEMPGIENEPAFTDNNVAVFAGGDYVATGTAAESEGLLLVAGDATFAKDEGGVFNVGSVGVGSQITPEPGATMLAVGGEVVIDAGTRVAVGDNIDGGGAARIGGAVSGEGDLTTNGAAQETDLGAAAAMDPHGDFGQIVADVSADLAAEPTTGTTTVSGPRVTFAGAGDGSQTFEIDAATLSEVSEVVFTGIPDGVAIAVTVTGGPVELSPNYVELNGERVDDPGSPEFGNAASQILWNVADAESLTVGGSSQVMGSILAPAADAEITASTNGRLYIGGDLTTSGTGNEQHNYPWIGHPTLECFVEVSEVGGFSVVKEVTGEAAGLVPQDTEFSVEYSYTVDGEPTSGTLSVPADGAVVAGPQDVPVGTVVSFVESGLPEVDGVVWGEPEFAPSSVTVAAGETATVTLTNTADATTTPAEVGGFSVVKEVAGEAADLVPESTELSVEYSYTVDGESTSGTLSVPADGTVVAGPQDLPDGTVVSLAEVDLPQVDGVSWGEPEFAPSSVTVTAGEDVVVTLTNTADTSQEPTETPGEPGDGDTPEPEPTVPVSDQGDTLPVTGSAAALTALGALLLLGLGIGLTVLARRRARA